jgi:cell division protein FtsZ
MTERGSALMGIGMATGENRATEAAKKSICSPLLETSINGARGVLMNITGGTNLSLYEVHEAADIVASASDPDVNMIFGAVINENLKDEILVTVIATSFDHAQQENVQPSQMQTSHVKQMYNKPDPSFPSNHQFSSFSKDNKSQDSSEDRYFSEKYSHLDVPTFLRNKFGRNK